MNTDALPERSPRQLDEGGPPRAVVCGDLNLLRCLVGHDIPLVVVASDAHEPTLRSRYSVDSRLIRHLGDTEGALDDLERLGRGYRERPVLYYGTDAMLLLVSRHRDRLAKTYRFTMPGAELVEALVDKGRFQRLAVSTGIPVPDGVSSSQLRSADELLARLPLPYAFKPSVHIGWMHERAERAGIPQKALVATTSDEARRLYEELSAWGPFVVQRWVSGGEDQIYSFHSYADESARIVGWFVGRKIRTYPRQSGVSTYLELCQDADVARLGFELVERLGVCGPLKIDIKKDAKSGELYVLELNPRFSLWCYLGAASGVNLPKMAYVDMTQGPEPGRRDYRIGVKWLSFGDDLRSFVRSYRPDGELTVFQWMQSIAASERIYDIFSWRDPGPWVYSARRWAEAASRRLGRRVVSSLSPWAPS